MLVLFGVALLLTVLFAPPSWIIAARTESADATINLTPAADTYVASGRPNETFLINSSRVRKPSLLVSHLSKRSAANFGFD